MPREPLLNTGPRVVRDDSKGIAFGAGVGTAAIAGSGHIHPVAVRTNDKSQSPIQAMAVERVPIWIIVNADPGRAFVVDVGQHGATRNCLRKATRGKAEYAQKNSKRAKGKSK